MEHASARIAAVLTLFCLAVGAAPFLQLSGPLGASASDLSSPAGTHIGSFTRDTVTVKVSGSLGGVQVGPFMNLHFPSGGRERTLTVHLDQVISAGGQRLDGIPIHLYRSVRGPVQAGEEIVAFSEPPLLQSQLVASDGDRDLLVWTVEPGDYFLFFGWTRPIVRVAPEDRPAEVTYTVMIE